MLAHDFVGLDRASALQRFLADKASRIGRPLRLRVQLRGFEGVCRMVECGVGLGIVPETTARRAAKTMALAIVAARRALGGARPHHLRRARSRTCRPTRASSWRICGQREERST